MAKQLFIDQGGTSLGTPAPGQDGPRPARDTQGDPGNGTYRGPGATDNGYTKNTPGAQSAPAAQKTPAPLNSPAMDTAGGAPAAPAMGAVLAAGGFGLIGTESGLVARLRRRRRQRRGTRRDGHA